VSTLAPPGATGPDRYDGRLVGGLVAPLDAFNAAFVLTAADVHVAGTLGRLTGEADPLVLLAAALAARAPRIGHVCVDLATVAATTVSDAEESIDVRGLPWPEVGGWRSAVAASPLVTAPTPPLRLDGDRLYLDRYWAQERLVAADID
jgi:exodeoxyribonuclease V alpha subunit